MNPSTAIIVLIFAAAVVKPSSQATDTFIYVGCSRAKFSPATQYSTNVDALLSSIVNAASYSSFNKFTVGGGTANAAYGLFQCRPDLGGGDCGRCVGVAVSRLGSLCSNSAGAALQLDGCFVKFDNVAFLGAEDKSLVAKKCGPQLGYGDSGELTRRDAVLSELGGVSQQLFRVGGSGSVRAVAECVGDLSGGECQDCLAEAIGRLKGECGSASWGDVFLAKCYARYSVGVSRAPSRNGGTSSDDETEKTLAILIGLIAVVALIVIFAAFLRKMCEEKDIDFRGK